MPSSFPVSFDGARRVLDHALARGGCAAGLFVEVTRTSTLQWDDGRLDAATAGTDAGAALTVHDGADVHTAHVNALDEERLAALADGVARTLGRARERGVVHGAPVVAAPDVRRWPDAIPVAERAARLVAADRAARDLDPRVTQVALTLATSRRTRLVVDADGGATLESIPFVTFQAHVTAAARGRLRSATKADSATRGWEFLDEAAAIGLAREAARIACLQLDAAPAPAGTMTVVLGSRAGGTMVHEACGHGLEADFFLERLSIYAGRLGQTVASPLVTVVDDGTAPGRRGTSAFDDEGTPARRVVLIERGVLTGLLHSRSTAAALGMAPTGNGRRESYRHPPLPRMRNTFIAPGEDDPADIVASVEDGLYVAAMGGGEVDIVSGNFVFHCAEAYRIRGGRLAEPVEGATLAGNGPAVLRAIDRVGNDLGWAVGTCGKEGQGVPVADAQPTLRVPGLVVGGAG